MAALLSFLSLWLPALFEGDGAVGCAGYGPLPSGLAELWSGVYETWLDLRWRVAYTYEQNLVLNGLPMVGVLLSGAVAAWSKRWLGMVVGLAAALLVAVVALHWALMAFSYFLLAGCAGWEEGRLVWMLWRLLLVAGHSSAVLLLIAGVRARRTEFAAAARG
ncbi:hypothetical protein [Nonomuraea jabiensis]|uniref:hypothetical protein n=1 Tax=Nonomuraea jabiensis TaxID=882448 RepID=UPI003D743877